MTWGTPAEGSDEAFFEEFAAPVEDLMQLSDEQLGQLLGAEGATVPVMLDDASAAAGSEDDVANPSVAIDLPPENAAQAIDKGLALYKNGDYPEALAAFTSALDLPGSGPVRSRKARVMPAGPSQGFADASVSLNEQIAIHYNCACCHARMDDAQSGLVSLVRAMEAGYDDYENVRTDPDIAPLRADGRFEGIMAKFEPKGVIEGFSQCSVRERRGSRRRGGGGGGGGGAPKGGRGRRAPRQPIRQASQVEKSARADAIENDVSRRAASSTSSRVPRRRRSSHGANRRRIVVADVADVAVVVVASFPFPSRNLPPNHASRLLE